MNDLLHFLKLNLLYVSYSKNDTKWNHKDMITPFVRLILITEGSANAYYTNQSFNLKKGYMYLIPSNTHNSFWCETYHEQYSIGFFEEVKLGTSIFDLKQFNYEFKSSKNDYLLFKRLQEINPNKHVLNNTQKAHMNKILSVLNQPVQTPLNHHIETQGILSILLSRFIKNSTINNSKINFKDDLNKVLDFISKNLHENLTVASLAKHYNLSPDHFSRTFKLRFNIGPSKYIQLKRIKHAQFLLITTKYSLKQIAEIVGLNNLSYFSRKFKEITGISPNLFRKKQLNNLYDL